MTNAALNQTGSLILNIADPVAPTVHEIGSHIAKAMDWKGILKPINVADAGKDSLVGWTPWSVPAPFTLSTEAAQKIGYIPVTDYARSVTNTCQWLRNLSDEDWQQRFPALARYTIPLFDYVSEDAYFMVSR
ncbi:hypothetical protein [Ochrobactrum teleogrylli]|uniref:Uncharacterized protein n=1 Tax=Ochrobactrum teleogrylli TaxID=2479765 RepID=A0ABD5JUG1_9HYPH